MKNCDGDALSPKLDDGSKILMKITNKEISKIKLDNIGISCCDIAKLST
jgi:hypothetical protein